MAMPWEAAKLPAIVQAWYPGQEGGRALAEILFGDVNPAGRLPITFYRSTDDLPAFLDYSMANRTYRYFKGKPLVRLRPRPELHAIQIRRRATGPGASRRQ